MYSRGESEKINVKKWTTQLPNIVDESLNCVEAPINVLIPPIYW